MFQSVILTRPLTEKWGEHERDDTSENVVVIKLPRRNIIMKAFDWKAVWAEILKLAQITEIRLDGNDIVGGVSSILDGIV